MISCVICSKENKKERKMYNIEVVLPEKYLENLEEGIICGSCLFDQIDKDTSLEKHWVIKTIYKDLKKEKFKFLF